MNIPDNPMGREYSPQEWAAARRRGLTVTRNNPDMKDRLNGGPKQIPGGPLIWATGNWHPDNARKQAALARKAAADWDLVAAAMDREWAKDSGFAPTIEAAPHPTYLATQAKIADSLMLVNIEPGDVVWAEQRENYLLDAAEVIALLPHLLPLDVREAMFGDLEKS